MSITDFETPDWLLNSSIDKKSPLCALSYRLFAAFSPTPFNDINGMRAGSAVQMMGLRIGQVEDIIPIIEGKDSCVNFVL